MRIKFNGKINWQNNYKQKINKFKIYKDFKEISYKKFKVKEFNNHS
jgi:hypothetical protein